MNHGNHLTRDIRVIRQPKMPESNITNQYHPSFSAPHTDSANSQRASTRSESTLISSHHETLISNKNRATTQDYHFPHQPQTKQHLQLKKTLDVQSEDFATDARYRLNQLSIAFRQVSISVEIIIVNAVT